MYFSRTKPLLTLLLAYIDIPLVHGREDFEFNAVAATRVLQQWYNQTTGLWQSTGWWNSANCLTVLADLTAIDRQLDIVTGEVWPNTFENAQKFNLKQSRSPNQCETTVCTRDVRIQGQVQIEDANPKGFLNGFYDDEGWWALAWIKVFDLTQGQQYLQAAMDIFDDMATTGYNATCGGIWWDRKQQHNTAIANELFLSVAAHLANRVPEKKDYYVEWAKKQWTWFDESGLINKDNTVNDGLDIKTCKNDGGIIWSYNQGVIVGALVELDKAAPGDSQLISRARDIATGAIKHLSGRDGILHDPREPNLGGDGYQFKGVFMRNLHGLQKVTGDQTYKDFIEKNAQSIWEKAQKDSILGPVWSGPFDKDHTNAATQSSGLDAMVAAAAVQ
ncbi:Six-hairpin glycosidase [Tothia fuscella]|uniref:Six-hairpin glycosidase n=1 Tax=Tothia fuscella TaxID=1048955 RepID=A0A9P4NTA9_9PEZI|nr:Six-hairpin glycosidase [Tothia fuscella]